MTDRDYDFLRARPSPAKPTPTPTPDRPPTPNADVYAALLKAHNEARQSRRLGLLTLNPKLMQAAEAHSQDCAKRGRLSHTGSDGSTPFQRMARFGYKYTWAAENIAWNQQTVEAVMKAWMGSLGHRANILGSNYRDVGFGYVKDSKGGVWWTACFGATAASNVAATAVPFEHIDATFASAYRPPE